MTVNMVRPQLVGKLFISMPAMPDSQSDTLHINSGHAVTFFLFLNYKKIFNHINYKIGHLCVKNSQSQKTKKLSKVSMHFNKQVGFPISLTIIIAFKIYKIIHNNNKYSAELLDVQHLLFIIEKTHIFVPNGTYAHHMA